MIVPDANLLVDAYNSESRVHAAARAWWEDLLNGTRPVGLAWVTCSGSSGLPRTVRFSRSPCRPRP